MSTPTRSMQFRNHLRARRGRPAKCSAVPLTLPRETLTCISALALFTDCDGGEPEFMEDVLQRFIADNFEERTGYSPAEFMAFIRGYGGLSLDKALRAFVEKARDESDYRGAVLQLAGA